MRAKSWLLAGSGLLTFTAPALAEPIPGLGVIFVAYLLGAFLTLVAVVCGLYALIARFVGWWRRPDGRS